jgi:hypothetical protein
MVLITAARMIGLKHHGHLDYVWVTFFVVIAAEIGLMLVAITAFRALYVAKAKNVRAYRTITTFNWYHKRKSAVVKMISTVSRNSRGRGTGSVELDSRGKKVFIKGKIPRGTMTGVRIFIDRNGNESEANLVSDDKVLQV